MAYSRSKLAALPHGIPEPFGQGDPPLGLPRSRGKLIRSVAIDHRERDGGSPDSLPMPEPCALVCRQPRQKLSARRKGDWNSCVGGPGGRPPDEARAARSEDNSSASPDRESNDVMGKGCYDPPMAFTYDAGRVSLDLLATLSNRKVERLPDPRALTAWLRAGGLVEGRCGADGEDLAHARTLRGAVFAVVDAELRDQRPSLAQLQQINAAAAMAAPIARLGLGAGGLHRERTPPSVAEALGVIARDAIDLLVGPQRELLRECAAPDCSGIYLDASPGRTRRWCSAARCGNRARVAAHRARRAAAVDPSGL